MRADTYSSGNSHGTTAVKKPENVRFNILGSWKVERVTADVDSIFWLIDADIVNAHNCWHLQAVKINIAEVW